MSLDFRFTDIKNYKTVCYQEVKQEDLPEGETLERMVVQSQHVPFGNSWAFARDEQGEEDRTRIRRISPVTSSLVWSTITLHMRGITEENVADFYVRHRLYEELLGPSLINAKGEGRMITFDEIKAHIGLTVNVCEESWAFFAAALMERARERFLPQEYKGVRQASWVGSPSQAIGDALALMEKASNVAADFSMDEEDKPLEKALRWLDEGRRLFEEAKWAFETAELERDYAEEE